MKKCKKQKIKINYIRDFISVFLGVFIALFLFVNFSDSAPLLANYYLTNLTGNESQTEALSKYDTLVLTPAQIYVHQGQIKAIRRKNPEIIILAYVPSQSYNTKYYPNNPVFKYLKVPENCWLYSGSGKHVTFWTDLQMVNMSKEWSDYYSDFINERILSLPQVDGVFLDMVDGGISGLNGGDIDIDGDGSRDSASVVDKEWVKRVSYFLEIIGEHTQTKYVIINGSSKLEYQSFINGRMYETFPTPWEQSGNWGKIMTVLDNNQNLNLKPQLDIFNSNTGNTGQYKNYRQMRFGLTSSLLLDNIYFSFDHGDQSHGQLWWYDEYNIDLGESLSDANSKNNQVNFSDDLWWRNYSNGISITNSTNSSQELNLGEDYEKIIGTQDKITNDGSIVSNVVIPAKDGLLMLKTSQSISNVPFKNGDFLRFYYGNGDRSRNGFFAYDSNYTGQAKIYKGNLDEVAGEELILAIGPIFQIYNSTGGRWLNYYPFGGGFRGNIDIAVGNLYNASTEQIVIAPSLGNEIILYNYHGKVLINKFYPLGEKYNQGFSVAIGNVDNSDFWGEIIIGTGDGRVLVFDHTLSKLKKTFYPFGKSFLGNIEVASGDTDYSKFDKIIATDRSGKKGIKVISFDGGETEFAPSEFTMGQYRDIYSSDVNFDGRDEVVVLERD